MSNEIKKEHQQLIRKIANFSIENKLSDDFVITTITSASVMGFPTKESGSGGIALFKSFGSVSDMVNLCCLIEHHYSLVTICESIINFRITGEI